LRRLLGNVTFSNGRERREREGEEFVLDGGFLRSLYVLSFDGDLFMNCSLVSSTSILGTYRSHIRSNLTRIQIHP
jgi:hypothetical protein